MLEINESNLKKIIAEKVKIYRKISQDKLAEEATISLDTISRIERENTLINVLTLIKLCKALNVTPNDLLNDFFDEESINGKINNEILILSEDEKKLILEIAKRFNQSK